MKRRATIVGVVALAGALGGLAWFCLGSGEPAYQGRSLRVWIGEYQEYQLSNQGSPDRVKRDQAQAAIKQIGTNALPTLLVMAGTKDSALKDRFVALAGKESLIGLPLHPAADYHAKATCGFGVLGPAAKPAVPALIGLLQDEDWEVRASAAECLSLIGPEAALGAIDPQALDQAKGK